MHLSVKLKRQIAVSLSIDGMALNIDEKGWTNPIPYAELRQPLFQERLSKVFPRNKEFETEDEFHANVLEFIKHYSM